MRICVYCASSAQCDPDYHRSAFRLGELLADAGCTTVYGGGGMGSMGALADGALSRQGHVIGIIPRFMTEVEWQHPGLATLDIVEDMRERKHRLLTGSDAVVALPGGCGTLEEVFEAITLKRLGLYLKPIVFVNTWGYYDGLRDFLQHTIRERMMGEAHAAIWQFVDTVEDVLPVIRASDAWPEDARAFAALKPS
ncbi:MAG: TIGR00730 family Rossman fold protein [Xanthomonadales bacterium]|nr:TIGR00730 family Rossman fold protein [Xanthomonadales bacterium]MBP7624031.1 TIGR00730 family Rossman fold protein [Xanthomonadales bacterium]